MRLRKQAKPHPAPGDEFLRAVSSGPVQRAPEARPRPAHDANLREQLLETERRAVAAEGALRQIQEESGQRLGEARSAIERERAGRIAAEQELERADSPPPAPAPAEAEETDQELSSQPLEEDVIDDEPGPGEDPPVEEPAVPAVPVAGGDLEGRWPTPWLGPKRSNRRRLFGRAGD